MNFTCTPKAPCATSYYVLALCLPTRLWVFWALSTVSFSSSHPQCKAPFLVHMKYSLNVYSMNKHEGNICFLRYLFSHFQKWFAGSPCLLLSVFSSFIYTYTLLFLSGSLFRRIFRKLYPLALLKTNKGLLPTALRKNGPEFQVDMAANKTVQFSRKEAYI